MTVEEFESAALAALTAGEHPTFSTLRQQVAAAAVERREVTDSGFFTYYSVPKAIPRVKPANLEIGDVQFVLKGASTPADAVIHVKNGHLDFLEAYVFEGDWPQEPEIVAVYYYGSEHFDEVGPDFFASRDLDAALDE